MARGRNTWLTERVSQTLGLVFRRVGFLAAIFVLASGGLFLAVKAIPGDPVSLRLKNPDPVAVAAERARLGLDRPVWEQYLIYVERFCAGDWGNSLVSGRPVRDDVAEFFPATLELSLAGLVLGIVIGVGSAVGTELFSSGTMKKASFMTGAVGLTVPIFCIGLLELIVGSLWLGWFPSGGRFDLSLVQPPSVTGFLTIDSLLAGNSTAFAAALSHLILPAFCLSLYPAAQVGGVLRARLRDPRLQTLTTALRARGFGPARIWGRHLLRVVSPPVITAVGTTFGALLGGAVLTETVFSWPGIGRYLVTAVLERDVYAFQNAMLLVVLLVAVVVLVSDVVAVALNPVSMRDEEGNR